MNIPELLAAADELLTEKKNQDPGDALYAGKQLARAIRTALTGNDGETFALYHARVVEERDGLKAENAKLREQLADYQRARVVELTEDNCMHNREIDPDAGKCGDCGAWLP